MANRNDVVVGNNSSSGSSPAQRRAAPSPFKGIRMRKWGKWVEEVREPNKRTRIWLGSYYSPIAAARAYDTAMYYLRGPTARLNFPELVLRDTNTAQLSAASIRELAVAVGARVDAETCGARVRNAPTHNYGLNVCWFVERIDLNELPIPYPDDE